MLSFQSRINTLLGDNLHKTIDIVKHDSIDITVIQNVIYSKDLNLQVTNLSDSFFNAYDIHRKRSREIDNIENLKSGLLALDMDAALKAANAVVESQNKSAAKEAVDAVTQALQVVGKRFQTGEWFLSELVYAGEISKELMNLLSPLMQAESSQSKGNIVIGTVAGDLHDLGKNIFINYAKSAGFNVIDLGVNIKTNKFVEAVKEHKPIALGMSCLLTSTEPELGKVIEELKKQGLREGVKVVIGGAALSQRVADDIKADAFAPDAITGLDIIKGWSTSK